MFFRAIVFAILAILVTTKALAAEVQRIGIAEFTDMSSPSTEIMKTIIQNSLTFALNRERDFSISPIPHIINELSEARSIGLSQKLDHVIYGSYRREGGEFVILIQIYDVLENEVRMSRLYQGEYSHAIFDTVDVIARSASQEIRRALPMLQTEEEIARAQAKRRAVHDAREVPIRREMRLFLGMMPQIASFAYADSKNFSQQGIYQGHSAVLAPTLSLSFRLEWFRISFHKGGTPWSPTLYQTTAVQNSNWYIMGAIPAPSSKNGILLHPPLAETLEVKSDVFLGSPLGNQWFVSLGMGRVSFSPLPDGDTVSSFSLNMGAGLAARNWEFSFLAQVFPLSQGWGWLFPTDMREYHSATHSSVNQVNFPMMTVRGAYFFSPAFGINVKIGWADFQNVQSYKNVSLYQTKKHLSTWMAAVEFVYRFQFGF